MKKGEKEAKVILEKTGIEFDNNYQDDNSEKSMPDLKYKSGRYLEVTHTKHNISIFTSINRYSRQPISTQLEKSQKAAEALGRIQTLNYKKDEKERKQYKEDCRLLKKHMGYDPTSFKNHFSEFKCDVPIISFSADNIIDEITEDKAEKYPNGDTDLFVFVSIDEYKCFFELLHEYNWIACGASLVNHILASPFQAIYICVWDIENQKYNVDNPIIKEIIKRDDHSFKVVTLQF